MGVCARTVGMAIAIALLAPVAAAQTGSFKWSLSPILAMHAPQLGDINDKALRAPMIGTGKVCPEPCGGESSEVTHSVHLVNSPGSIGGNANVGLEFQWVQSEKNTFLMGYSTWEGTSSNHIETQLPVQKELRDVDYLRRDSISYNEFYFGWKHSLFVKPTKYRLYSRLSLNEIFDVDFRDEHVFTIRGGELDAVKRIFIGKGQTTGVLMGQVGLGGEYFLKKNMSVGAEAGYKFSERPFTFRNTSRDSNIGGGDNVDLVPPVRPGAERAPLGYIPPDLDPSTDWTLAANNPTRVPVTDMQVRFDGWALALRFTIYY